MIKSQISVEREVRFRTQPESTENTESQSATTESQPVRHADVFLAVRPRIVLDDRPLLLAPPGTLCAVEVAGAGLLLQELETVLHRHTSKLLQENVAKV